jgi:hypothetical protein
VDTELHTFFPKRRPIKTLYSRTVVCKVRILLNKLHAFADVVEKIKKRRSSKPSADDSQVDEAMDTSGATQTVGTITDER